MFCNMFWEYSENFIEFWTWKVLVTSGWVYTTAPSLVLFTALLSLAQPGSIVPQNIRELRNSSRVERWTSEGREHANRGACVLLSLGKTPSNCLLLPPRSLRMGVRMRLRSWLGHLSWSRRIVLPRPGSSLFRDSAVTRCIHVRSLPSRNAIAGGGCGP